MARKDVIRKDDKVRIEVPKLFQRCGYPKTLQSETDEVSKEFRDEILKFIGKVLPLGRLPGRSRLDFAPGDERNALFSRVAKEVAYYRLKINGMGGRERQIYTEENSYYKDKVVRVEAIKFVKTGTYFPPSSSYCYDYGCYEYDPGGLDHEKTHKILLVRDVGYGCGVWIEAANVVKVTEVPV